MKCQALYQTTSKYLSRGNKNMTASKRGCMHCRFVTDMYVNSFACYFTVPVYAKYMGKNGSEPDGSNLFDTFCFLFSLSLSDDVLPMG